MEIDIKKRLIHDLGNLAAEASDQIIYLRSIGLPNGVDELALEFHDSFLLADQFLESGLISQRQYDAIVLVDRALDEVSGQANADLWDNTALSKAVEWARIRILAKVALTEFRF